MEESKIVFIGRLEQDTGLLQFTNWLSKQSKKYKVDFVGDGSLRAVCTKFGAVHGFTSAKKFLKSDVICVPGGYLSYIEAKETGCKVKTFFDNSLKKDYWGEISRINGFPTWDEVADQYLQLWGVTK